MSAPAPHPGEGTVTTTEDGGHLVRFLRILPYPMNAVWDRLTARTGLREWLADAPRLDLIPGGVALFVWPDPEGEGEITAHGHVTEVEFPSVVEYATDAYGRLRFELRGESTDGAGTGLEFTAALPSRVPDVACVLAGWHLRLDRLAAVLAGEHVDPRADDSRQLWHELYERYRAARAAASPPTN